jgi:hypothetical protein
VQRTAAPVIAKKSEAQALQKDIDVINELAPYETQSVLLAELSSVLPKDGSYISEWQFAQGNLKLLISAGSTVRPIATMVEAFQANGFFSEVRAAATQPRQAYALEMRVVPGKFKALTTTAKPAAGLPPGLPPGLPQGLPF